jgi:hypothetical protein
MTAIAGDLLKGWDVLRYQMLTVSPGLDFLFACFLADLARKFATFMVADTILCLKTKRSKNG